MLSAGQKMAPNDKRFPVELAGVAFKQKKYGEAENDMQRALRLDAKDEYANEFLATVYFLEGNLEAALKYWNRIGKPQIAEVRSREPVLKIRPALLDHAFAFAPASTLTLDELLASNVRLRGLEIFPTHKLNLSARPDGKFDVIFRAQELNGFGNGKLQALVRMFSGALFEEITPEYYNVRGSVPILFLCPALIPTSGVRWPRSTGRSGEAHYGATAWALISAMRTGRCNLFTGPSTFLGATNLRREGVDTEISRFVDARWSWTTGVELSHRDFRNVIPGVALTPELAAKGYQIKQKAQFTYGVAVAGKAPGNFQQRQFPGGTSMVATGAVI